MTVCRSLQAACGIGANNTVSEKLNGWSYRSKSKVEFTEIRRMIPTWELGGGMPEPAT